MSSTSDSSERQQRDSLVRRAAREGLAEFALAVDPRYEVNWHHRVIARKLEEVMARLERGESPRVMFWLPPRHGKSEMVTQKFPAWVLGHHPEYPIITSSYSQDLANDFGQNTRDIMGNPNYQAIFPGTNLRPDSTAKGRWLTDQRGGYTAVGVGGTITGRGFKVGIIDDPFKNREEADSEVVREARWKWYTSTLYTRQEGSAAILLILTRWHDDDLAGRLIAEQELQEKSGEENYDRWEIVRFPAVAEEDEAHRRKGEALWESRFPLEKLERTRKAVGPYDWSALYQQDPVDEATQEFKARWFKPSTWEDVKKMNTRKFATIDPALSKTTSADGTGVVRNYVDLQNVWHVRASSYRLNPKAIVDLIFQLHEEGMEKIGIEEGMFKDAVQPFLEDEMRKRGQFPRVEPLRHNAVKKETRIRGLIPRYASGSICHLEGECDDLEHELVRFPKGRHDDVADAMAYQLQIAEQPYPDSGEEFGLYRMDMR